ncbi:phage protein [uncultured Amphritea sp.]|uniref:phage protein n=1 Tax=uncultured Amphritea sp. TaxID=981605 RepID=UPI0025D7915A|nr:phage protein [uncultured Amphritea sp.]
MSKISGMSFDFDLSGTQIHADKMTLDITDNTTVAKTKGVPNGHTDGDVEAAGEMELDSTNYLLVMEQAKAAGSFRALKPFDITSYAKAGDDELKVEAFGCKLTISSLLDVDNNSADKTVHKLPFIVTDPDFVKINGVPYLTSEETAGLL